MPLSTKQPLRFVNPQLRRAKAPFFKSFAAKKSLDYGAVLLYNGGEWMPKKLWQTGKDELKMVRNKVKLMIAGAEYAILTEDDVKYVSELGKEVDLAIAKAMKENPRVSTTQAAVLTTLQYADDCKKATASADRLREQIKDYLDDASSAKAKADLAKHEAEKAKRELENANLEIDRLKAQLSSVLEQIGKKKNEK